MTHAQTVFVAIFCVLTGLVMGAWRPKRIDEDPADARPIVFIKRPLTLSAWVTEKARVECTWDSVTGVATMTTIQKQDASVHVARFMAYTLLEPASRADWEALTWLPATETLVNTQ